MLSENNRLKKKKNIEEVFKKGKNFKEKLLILKVVKNNFKISRFCLIISQKVSKRANVRNKIKRKLSELIRLKIKKIKKGFDVVIIAVPELEKRDFSETERMFNNLFKKANLIEGEK